MPLLFSLGQHAAPAAVNARLQDSERLFAYLDHIYVICSPRRVLEVHRVLQEELWAHARIRIHHGKTQLWNQGGSEPAWVADLTFPARLVEVMADFGQTDFGQPFWPTASLPGATGSPSRACRDADNSPI